MTISYPLSLSNLVVYDTPSSSSYPHSCYPRYTYTVSDIAHYVLSHSTFCRPHTITPTTVSSHHIPPCKHLLIQTSSIRHFYHCRLLRPVRFLHIPYGNVYFPYMLCLSLSFALIQKHPHIHSIISLILGTLSYQIKTLTLQLHVKFDQPLENYLFYQWEEWKINALHHIFTLLSRPLSVCSVHSTSTLAYLSYIIPMFHNLLELQNIRLSIL